MIQEPVNLLETATESDPTETASRRAFLTRFAALGAGLAALQFTAHAQNAAGQTAVSPSPATPSMAPMPVASVPGALRVAATPPNELQYRVAIAPVGMLSLETSRIAVNKAVDPAVRQFANFELSEQIALNKVLMEMKTPTPPMSAEDRAVLLRAQNTPAGPDFDRDYISNQRDGHVYLRDTAVNYLGTPMPRRGGLPEMHGRHLATMNVPAHTEHIAHTEEIMVRMMA